MESTRVYERRCAGKVTEEIGKELQLTRDNEPINGKLIIATKLD